jgi:hypothetical protein
MCRRHSASCGSDVSAVPQTTCEAYDRIEIPEIKPDVTRVTLYGGVCPCCTKRFKAVPPVAIAHRRPHLADTTLRSYAYKLDGALDALMRIVPINAAGKKLQQAIKSCRRYLFVFLVDRAIEPTNNGSEQALRPCDLGGGRGVILVPTVTVSRAGMLHCSGALT